MNTKQTGRAIKWHHLTIKPDRLLPIGFPCIGTEEGNLIAAAAADGDVLMLIVIADAWLCKGALTKGDRRAATGADLMEFNFDTPYGRTSLRTIYSAICQVIVVSKNLYPPNLI